MLDVCLLGCGGMMPLPRRALTSLMVRFNGSSVLIDCGEGTQVSIRRWGWSFHSIDTILITHCHGDHISGLPGLLLSMGNAEREEPVTIIGPKGVKKVINSLLIIAPGLPFDLNIIEIENDLSEFSTNGFQIKAFKVAHNIICYGYSLEIKRAGKFDPVKAKENNVPMAAWSPLQKNDCVEIDGITYTKDMVLGPERKGLKVTYCTDSRPVDSIVENAKGADIFICEGMYGEKEKISQAKDKKHMTFHEAAQIAYAANPKGLWLTHYSPSLINPKIYLDEVRKIFENTHAGKDGMTWELKYEEE